MLRSKPPVRIDFPKPQPRTRNFLLGVCCLLGLLAVVIVLVFWLSTIDFSFKQQFPKLEGLKNTSFTWSYKDQDYSLELALYESVNRYYGNEPKIIYEGEKEESYSRFVSQPEEDDSIKTLAQKITELGKQNSLEDDKIVDLVLAFVQSIAYDEASLSAGFTPRYPYEVLYDKTGVCSGKSFLAYSIISELGYGIALFDYEPPAGEQFGHLAIGVQCPTDYSSYNSGYCYGETTNTGWRIGTVANLGSDMQALDRLFSSYEEQEDSTPLSYTLKDAGIFVELSGKEYQKIVENVETENQIESLMGEMEALKTEIDTNEAKLEEIKTEMDSYEVQGDYQNYNRLVPVYNDLLATVKWQISQYNAKVETYNELISRY